MKFGDIGTQDTLCDEYHLSIAPGWQIGTNGSYVLDILQYTMPMTGSLCASFEILASIPVNMQVVQIALSSSSIAPNGDFGSGHTLDAMAGSGEMIVKVMGLWNLVAVGTTIMIRGTFSVGGYVPTVTFSWVNGFARAMRA